MSHNQKAYSQEHFFPYQDKQQCRLIQNKSFITPKITLTNTKLDAIFVPTHRESIAFLSQIDNIAAVTEEVWLLLSKQATHFFYQMRQKLPKNVRLMLDTPHPETKRWFSQLPSSQNPSNIAHTNFDLPLKRNIALQVSRMIGYERIGLLDDDIIITENQIRQATSVLCSEWPISGFLALNFPDVSTLEHIHRFTTGDISETMPGGSSLFLYVPKITGFFPYIYNEDWIFIYSNLTKNSLAIIGEVNHDYHSPWEDITRIRFEEFGEIIITGVLSLSCNLWNSELLSEQFWNYVLEERKIWLLELQANQKNDKYKLAIDTALSMLASIDSINCIHFISALLCDMENNQCIPNLQNLLSQSMLPME